MDKKMLLHLVLLCAVVLVLAVPLYLMCRHDSDLLEFVGAVYGGLVTVIGIIVPIFTDRQKTAEETRRMYETEYRPQIKLMLSSHQYDFWTKKAQKGYPILLKTEPEPCWNNVHGVIPLQIQNIGNSDVKIEKVEFERAIDKTGNEKKCALFQYGNPLKSDFTIYCQESFDLPVQLEVFADTVRVIVTYSAIMGMDKQTRTQTHTKTYTVYIPSQNPFESYRAWCDSINISRRS